MPAAAPASLEARVMLALKARGSVGSFWEGRLAPEMPCTSRQVLGYLLKGILRMALDVSLPSPSHLAFSLRLLRNLPSCLSDFRTRAATQVPLKRAQCGGTFGIPDRDLCLAPLNPFIS